MKPMNRLTVALGLSVAAGLVVVPQQAAADAKSFLQRIEGSWKGNGKAKIPGREAEERISCKVDNVYNSEAGALEISGDCATTQAKSSVSGELVHAGNNVTGSLIGSFDGATITKSNGSISGGELVVSTNFLDNVTGHLTRSRQVVRITNPGFEAEFYTFSNKEGKFLKAGSIKFTSK